MFEAMQQNDELKALIKRLARPIDFDSFTARPTHGYFERVAARQALNDRKTRKTREATKDGKNEKP